MAHQRVYCKAKAQHIVNVSKELEINEIIKCFHISFDNRHLGINRTMLTIKKFYYFEKMLSRIQKYIKSCKTCKNFKNKNKILTSSDLRHKIKSVVGFSNTKKLNDELKRHNTNQ